MNVASNPLALVFSAMFATLIGGADTILILLWVVAAIGITILWGSKTFTRQQIQEAWA